MSRESEISCKEVIEFGTKDKNQSHRQQSIINSTARLVFLEKVPLKVNCFLIEVE